MVGGAESGGPENGPGSKPAPLVETGGGRVRFTVELTPGETTIVSWKKLLREANLSEPDRPGPEISGPSTEVRGGSASEFQPLPPPAPAAASHEKETKENETKESQANRLSNVIERIERMYAGNGSSDEEDLVLDNMPDDDEYDTEDSFIDDTDLDDYFQVDNATVKHDGFFVNRGKLEQIEPTISMEQQQKKRRGKDLAQGGGSDDGPNPHKIMKMGNKERKASSSSIPRSSTAKKTAFMSNKEPLMERKEGSSSVRPKTTDLEKAFRELEKIVEQFRPPSAELQGPGNQSQSVKRRLPPEIKMTLAKVARIAGSIYGRIPKDVINRLMSILGHLMQITTLKRNLRAMANMALSAKKEKDDQIQKMKQEIATMVKLRTVRMKSKDDADSDDFQEAGLQEREVLRCKYRMDDVLENKLCDLYDLYIMRVEEESGSPVRKLYEELALLWPSGFMHTDGIKRAIYRAKERKGICSSRKDRDKIKKKVVEVDAIQTTNTHKKVLLGSTLISNPLPVASNPKQENAKKSISKSAESEKEAHLGGGGRS